MQFTSARDDTPIKLLFMGESGSGKTGALASLLAAGYNVRVLDYDNGVEVLRDYLTNPASAYVKQAPDLVSRFHYERLSDEFGTVNGKIICKKALAWQRGTLLLDKWKTGDVDLGPVASWGLDDVLVIDTLSHCTNCALRYHLMLNGALMADRTQNEARRDIGAVQSMIRKMLELLYSSAVKCHVIVNSHITFVDEAGGTPQRDEKGTLQGIPQGYPAAIGRALSPHIPEYFNHMLLARAMGGRHRIYTKASMIGGQAINTKTPAPLRVAAEYPLETGLADYFRAVRGQ